MAEKWLSCSCSNCRSESLSLLSHRLLHYVAWKTSSAIRIFEVGELAKQTLECMEDCPLAIGKQLLISKDVPFNCNRYATVLILMRV